MIGLLSYLQQINAALDAANVKFQQLRENIMTTKVEFDALMAEVDAETTRIATRLEELLGQIQAGGMTAEEETAAFGEVATHLAQLKTIGAPQP